MTPPNGVGLNHVSTLNVALIKARLLRKRYGVYEKHKQNTMLGTAYRLKLFIFLPKGVSYQQKIFQRKDGK